MTKSDPVCGALTHKKTPCQNTLVTGCGLCPVHASQLRASNAPFKQKSKPRRKKPSSSFLQSQTHKHSPTTLIPTSLSLTHSALTHSSHTNHRTSHPLPHSDPSMLSDHFLYNISPVHQPQPDFYRDHPELHTLKTNTDVVDILKSHSLALVSPVTPRAPDSSLKADLFEEEQLRAECPIPPHSPSSDTHLHTSTDSYLLECDLPMDLSMPKFD